jgi:SHS family lactate transporter-like MFS transporter
MQASFAGAPTRLRDITSAQRNAFLAAFFGWMMDGYDFSILTFVLIDIQRSFTVDKALAGALGTVTLLFRLIGGIGFGTFADSFGRKTPLLLSILWIGLFSLLSGFSTSYAMLFFCRALFGIGMGGVWTAGLPLVLEHWPKNLRGTASGLLMGGFSWGYMLAAFMFQELYPFLSGRVTWGWRILFWIGASFGLLAIWIKLRVTESPVWQNRSTEHKPINRIGRLSIIWIFQRDLLGTTIQTAVLIAVFMFSYYSITFWYPTLLREEHLSPLPYLVALNLGAILGNIAWGRASETPLGRRGSVALASGIGVAVMPLFLGTFAFHSLLPGALLMGICGMGAWGAIPSYLSERFPTVARSVGPGFSYHAGIALGSITPTVIGALQDHGIRLRSAMSVCIAIGGLLTVIVTWLGPETRGQNLTLSE